MLGKMLSEWGVPKICAHPRRSGVYLGRPHYEGITNTRALFLDAFNRLCGLRAYGPFGLAAQLWTFFYIKELALDIVPYLIR